MMDKKRQQKLIEHIVGLCTGVLFDDMTLTADRQLPELTAGEWNDLLALASKHSVLPVVMHALDGRRFDNKDVRKTVMKWYAVAQRHQLRYQVRIQSIRELAGMFAEEKLDMMVFKGAALARLYPHPEWRVFSDIDFYLFGQWKEGVAVMERHDIKNQPYLHHNTEATMNGVLLENHYDFVERLNHKMNLVLDDALKAMAAEEGKTMKAPFLDNGVENVYVMTPTMDAIFQMRHMSAHFVSEAIPLRMLNDWILFLKQHADEVDWERVLRLYEQSGMSLFIGIVMGIVREHFHVAFPNVPIAPVANEQTERVWQSVVFPPDNNPYKKNSIRYLAYETKTFLGNRWKHQMVYPGESYFLLSLHYAWSVLKRKTGLLKMKRMACVLLLCGLLSGAVAQKREKYEFQRNLPVYADSLLKDLTYPLAWGNSEISDFSEWKKAARQKVFDSMLMPPPPPLTTHQAPCTILAEEQRNGYKARKLEIRLSRYYTVPAYVLIPDGDGPFPAVNLLHDHGAHLFIGKEKVIRPLSCEDSTVIRDADEWLSGYGGQFFGDYLAQHGFVVFSADAPMWGERGQKEGPRRDRYDMIAGNMMMYGIDLSAWMTYDDISGTEFLAQMPEVDARRIGCTGWSMGAYRAWMLAALSDRVKASASICWMVTTDEQMSFKYSRTENGGFANCLPGLRRWLDYPHIASIACPKAMLFLNGSQDKLFPVPGAEKAFRTMHDVWKSQHADDRLETELWDMPHSCPVKAQERVLQFFKKHL